MRLEEGHHKIFHDSALETMRREIVSESVDLIFVDPPYNIGKKFGSFEDVWPSMSAYVKWSKMWLEECLRVLKPSGSMYVMTSTQAMPHYDLFLSEKCSVLSRIVWHYDSSGKQAKRYFGSLYEPILFCVKDRKKYKFNSDDILIDAKTGSKRKLIDYRKATPSVYNSKKVPGNVWYYNRVRYRMEEYENHPSQKPEALLERIIKASSDEGDVVLDPFAGTFSTAAVAARLGRKTLSIESQEEYVKIGLRRVFGWREYEGKELAKLSKNFKRRNTPHKVEQSLFDAN